MPPPAPVAGPGARPAKKGWGRDLSPVLCLSTRGFVPSSPAAIPGHAGLSGTRGSPHSAATHAGAEEPRSPPAATGRPAELRLWTRARPFPSLGLRTCEVRWCCVRGLFE